METLISPTKPRSDDADESVPDGDALSSLSSLELKLQEWVNEYVPWRQRLVFAALIVGLLCGVVAMLYEKTMDFFIELVWVEGGNLFAEKVTFLPPWAFIPIVCITFGGLTGALIRLLGEPMANLPGVVLSAHRDGVLGHEEAPAMAAISLASITAGGSLGPEAPLVSIGGGLASLVAMFVDLSEAETLFVTMCGMGAGLAAFFGEPVGGALFACEVLHRYGLEYYELWCRPSSPASLATGRSACWPTCHRSLYGRSRPNSPYDPGHPSSVCHMVCLAGCSVGLG